MEGKPLPLNTINYHPPFQFSGEEDIIII